MGYIGVPDEHQENFHNRVIEAQSPFSDYKYPTTKEEYWSTVETYWKPLKNILDMYVSDNETLEKLLKEKDAKLNDYFQIAWFYAPDNGKIHLIPAWHILCDLCSESYLLYE